MALKIYNVLNRKKELFEPLQAGKVNMYVCGPTVYDYPHVGHAKTYVNFDVVVRYLRYLGYDVLYVQNLTDVGHLLDDGEDRILKKARQASARPMEIVERYARIYFDNMDALGVARPDISPRASAHVPEQIEMIQALIAKGHAYETNGSVYFSVNSFEEYGKLSGRRLDEQEEGTRIARVSEKRHPADFALWKRAEPEHILRWSSPWGIGFPGWHIECSAMAAKYLGETFDIHGGGIDNIFPHNECEIAQSEAAHGETFARYWMLVGSLTLEGVKMSKSLGNTLRIVDALEKYRPEAIRLLVLSGHYSNPIDLSDAGIDAADKGLQRIWGAVQLVRERLRNAVEGEAEIAVANHLKRVKADFLEKMDDDFNAAAAIGVLQDATRWVNTLINEQDGAKTTGSLTAINSLFDELGGTILGIVPQTFEQGSSASREDGLVRMLIEMRAAARENKDWAAADKIRSQLSDLGIVLEDRADGTIWKAA